MVRHTGFRIVLGLFFVFPWLFLAVTACCQSRDSVLTRLSEGYLDSLASHAAQKIRVGMRDSGRMVGTRKLSPSSVFIDKLVYRKLDITCPVCAFWSKWIVFGWSPWGAADASQFRGAVSRAPEGKRPSYQGAADRIWHLLKIRTVTRVPTSSQATC